MRFLIFFEGIFFACFYTTAPFFAFDFLNQSGIVNRIQEPIDRKEIRYILLSFIGFWIYYLYYILGLRTRYTIWHLERNRYGSGFIPLETTAVAFYHGVVLCLLSETMLPLIDHRPPELLSQPWLDHLGIRMKNIFLLSIIQHAFLELSGYWDKIRREYFHVERN